MGVLVLDHGVVPASPGDHDPVVCSGLTAGSELMEQRRCPEEEAGVAAIDVVLDDLGVEHPHSYHRGVNDPVRGEIGLGTLPGPDGDMRAHMETQEGRGGRRGDDFVGPGRIGCPSGRNGDPVLSGYSPSTLAISSTWARSTWSKPPLGVSVAAPYELAQLPASHGAAGRSGR